MLVDHNTPWWEWQDLQDAQRALTAALDCEGLLVRVHDGDFWGYKLYRRGNLFDQFVQDPDQGTGHWFPGAGGPGDPAKLARAFDWLRPEDVAPYLVQKPFDLPEPTGDDPDPFDAEYDRRNVRARPGDEFSRFDPCAVVDFLRLLGVRVEVRPTRVWPDRDVTQGVVTFLAPVFRQFWVKPDWAECRRRLRQQR